MYYGVLIEKWLVFNIATVCDLMTCVLNWCKISLYDSSWADPVWLTGYWNPRTNWSYCYPERLLLRRKWTFLQTNAVRHTIENYKLFNKIWIHASRNIIIDTEDKEGTGKSQIGRGHWVTDVCCYDGEPYLKLTWLSSCSVQLVSSFLKIVRVALLVKQWNFLN